MVDNNDRQTTGNSESNQSVQDIVLRYVSVVLVKAPIFLRVNLSGDRIILSGNN